MKKAAILLLALCLLLPGCTAPDYPADTFYSEDLLDSYSLTGLPVPNIANSRLNGAYLYCNLTQAEYDAYVAQVVAWLRARQDIYHLSYFHSSTLLFGAFPEDTYIPMPEDYDLSGNHDFAFTCTAERNGDHMQNPIRLAISREEGSLQAADFSYNTCIKIGEAVTSVRIDPCAAKHTYDEGTVYPVPGLDRGITVYTCVHCGDSKQDWYPDSRKSYAVTVARGRNYILSNNWNVTVAWDIDSLHAGGRLEITVRRATTGSTAMLVNGESIPVLREDENTQIFGFIMPESDIVIEIFPAETE